MVSVEVGRRRGMGGEGSEGWEGPGGLWNGSPAVGLRKTPIGYRRVGEVGATTLRPVQVDPPLLLA